VKAACQRTGGRPPALLNPPNRPGGKSRNSIALT
jgi:hypothetical protein